MPELLTQVAFGAVAGRIVIGTVAGFIPEW